jgi:CO dehydrogenase maturation factor
MKIAVSGKGGTGKSTIAGLLAHYLTQAGYRVLAVDADPDANLASALGIPVEKVSGLIPISAQRELIKERTGANPKQFGQLFKINPRVDDIPEEFSLEFRGIKLLVMGAVRKGGEGCACPENVLLKNLLTEILLNRDEAVVVDMEAGIEHLGRATSKAIDVLAIVVEPGARSMSTARTIMRLAGDIGVHSFAVIGNKIQTLDQRRWIEEEFPGDLVIGFIPYNRIIQDSDRNRLPLVDSLDASLSKAFQSLTDALIRRAGRKNRGRPSV